MIEARAYGPDLTDEERREIRARVVVDSPRLIVFRELPVQSPFSIALMHAHVEELVRGWDRFVYVIDLMHIKRPDSESRAMLRRCAAKIVPHVQHVAVAVGGNVFVTAMAKLVAYSMGYRSVSLHPNVVDACGGVIRIEDTDGPGVQFVVELPR